MPSPDVRTIAEVFLHASAANWQPGQTRGPRFVTAYRSIDPLILLVVFAGRYFRLSHGLGDGLSDFFVI